MTSINITPEKEDEIMEAYIEELKKFFFEKRQIYTAGAIVTYMLDLIEMIIEREGGKTTLREALAEKDNRRETNN